MTSRHLTAERLREYLRYEPETGDFFWIKTKNSNGQIGKEGQKAGHHMARDGYIEIGFDGVNWRAHRLAWLWMTGEFPKNLIDHKNRKRDDNRWENLREANHSQNFQNQKIRKDSQHGYKGIEYVKKANKWFVRVCVNKKRIYIGCYSTPEEALISRAEAERKYFTHSPACEPQPENLAQIVQVYGIQSDDPSS